MSRPCSRLGGPGFDLFEPNSNYAKVYVTKTRFTADDFRRMVYQAKPRAELDSFFGPFDCPDAGQVQPARTVSTTPLQALNMMNGEFLLDQAARFAARYTRKKGCCGVICGHIHVPAIRRIDGIDYVNCGDWIEHCTAVVEHLDGRLELVDHTWLADQPTLDEPPLAGEPIDVGAPLEPAA